MTGLIAAGPGHAAVISTLHGVCFGREAGTSWNAGSVAALLAMPGAFAFIAGRDDNPVGFVLARLAADEAEIITIGVIPKARRQGVATALLERTIDRAADGGARIFLEVAADNPAAIDFYRTHGFKTCGARPGYYRRRHGPVDGHIMVFEIIEK